MSARVLLIIPAYNEQEFILRTYNSIITYCSENNEHFDVIVINDCSKDSTSEILDTNNIPHIDLIHNLGIGGAVQTGYKYAKENNYDIAVQFDGDGQHDIRYVQHIVKPIIDNEAEFVIGSRFVGNENDNFRSSKARRIGIYIISFFIKLVTGKKVYDTTSGFRAVNKDIIEQFSKIYPIEYPEPITTTELLKKRYTFKEVSVKMHERAGGTSSIKAWKSVYYMINVILTILIIKIRRYPNVH